MLFEAPMTIILVFKVIRCTNPQSYRAPVLVSVSIPISLLYIGDRRPVYQLRCLDLLCTGRIVEIVVTVFFQIFLQ
jgi:hypothetical protein